MMKWTYKDEKHCALAMKQGFVPVILQKTKRTLIFDAAIYEQAVNDIKQQQKHIK